MVPSEGHRDRPAPKKKHEAPPRPQQLGRRGLLRATRRREAAVLRKTVEKKRKGGAARAAVGFGFGRPGQKGRRRGLFPHRARWAHHDVRITLGLVPDMG